MLKTTVLSQIFVTNEMLATNEIGDIESGNESIEKCEKLSKIGKLSKFQKLSKSQKLAKSRKKLSKSGNLPNFNTKENRPSFLTPDARMTFNYLRLAFIKALIFRHFDPKCHIWIETNASSYAIGGVLSQLASEIKPDGVVTKTDLSQWYL